MPSMEFSSAASLAKYFGHAGFHVAPFAAVERARRIQRQQARGPCARSTSPILS